MENLQGKKIGIYGIQGSGKTELGKYLLRNKFKKPFVISPNPKDWEKEKCFLYKTITNDKKIDYVCSKVKDLAIAGKIDVFLIDEADLFFKTNYDMKTYLNDLVINHRHYPEGKGLTLIFISRRPQDIPTKVVESCHYNYIYILEGANALRKWDEVHRGLSNMITQLSFEKHNFVVKEVGKEPYYHKPIPLEK